MPQLCVPVTDIFRQNQERILPLVDAVSFKEVTDEFFSGKKHMLECSLNIGAPLFPQKMEHSGILNALKSGRFSSFACDLGPAADDFEEVYSSNGYPRAKLSGHRLDEEEYIALAQQNTKWLRGHFSDALQLENLNYFPTPDGAYELICEPDFINRVLDAVDAELLLDVGHVLISSFNLSIPIEDYFAALPLQRVCEVHLSACGNINGIWEDIHEPPGPQELEILDQLCNNARIRYVTIEYYRDGDRLVNSYLELAARLGIQCS